MADQVKMTRRPARAYTLTRRDILAGSAGAILASGVRAAVGKSRPKPDHSNTLYIMPLWGGGLEPHSITDDEYRQQIAKMKREFGPGNDYNRLGFASIYATGNLQLLLRQLKVFQQENIHRGVIFALQTHDIQGGNVSNPNGDLRNYQWRLNGKTWRGVPGPVVGRDTLVVTPSR
ncbi:MAG: hypothetical protein ACP5O1_06260, partial [Phycisphaerae bacterium]